MSASPLRVSFSFPPIAASVNPRLVVNFAAVDLAELTTRYAHPLAIYMGGDMRLEHTPRETQAAIAARRMRAIAAGSRSILATIREVTEDAEHRFLVRADWSYRDAAGAEVGTSSIRYYCRIGPDGVPKVEILEFLRQAFPTQ